MLGGSHKLFNVILGNLTILYICCKRLHVRICQQRKTTLTMTTEREERSISHVLLQVKVRMNGI